MFSPPALFLFDIDGTLLKGTTTVHQEAFARAYAQVYGLPLSLTGVSAAGRTDRWLLAEVLRRHGLSEAEIEAGRQQAFDVMEAYVEERMGDLRDRVLPGVPEVLRLLHERGQMLGLLTGNLRRIALVKLANAGLRYFDTGGFGEESAIRADLIPVAVAKASEQAGYAIPASHVVVIGDTPLDVEAGRVHGARTAGVATGPFSEDQLRQAGADLVLPSLTDAEQAVRLLMQLIPA